MSFFPCSYAALFAGAPDVRHMGDEDETKQTTERFSILFKRFLAKPRLHACLENLVGDTIATFDAFDTSKPMDPFDTMYKLIFQLTHRTVGCNDVAADPKLLKKSLAMFTDLDATGAIEVMFPWLPTPVKLRKLWGGARMHWMFQRIMKQRREQDQPGNDAMQLMMDAGDTDLQISVVSWEAAVCVNDTNTVCQFFSSLSVHCLPEWSTPASTQHGSPFTSLKTKSGVNLYRLKSTPVWTSTAMDLATLQRILYRG